MSLAEEISGAWGTLLPSRSGLVSSPRLDGFPTYAVRTEEGEYGVAVPCPRRPAVLERFANVTFRVAEVELCDGRLEAVMLTSPSRTALFASICAHLVEPGPAGAHRESVVADPRSWWSELKSLIGNRESNPTVYDVLGELVALDYLLAQGYSPVWSGPTSGTADIDCGEVLFEVKSTVSRSSRTATVHGLYQLQDAHSREHLLYCVFEPSEEGVSINSEVDRLLGRGMDETTLATGLASLGYPAGTASRDAAYRLHAFASYPVDASFPRIAQDSFVGGALPAGVLGLEYTVSLDALDHEEIDPSTVVRGGQ